MPRAGNEYAGIRLIGLVTHPWTPLVGVVPLLCLSYLLLVQPSAGQLSGIKISQESTELILGANKLAPIFAFASAEQVLPWLGEQAQKANVALRQVKQLPDQQGLAIRLHGDFPRATTLIQQLVRGTNLLIQPPLILQSHRGPSGAGGLAVTGTGFALFVTMFVRTARIRNR